MAKATKPAGEVPVTGLGETIEQVEQKCEITLKKLLPYFKKDVKIADACEAAFQWALPEKRARKLRKKIGK